MRASEIRVLAERAAIGPDVSVLDLCCGIGKEPRMGFGTYETLAGRVSGQATSYSTPGASAAWYLGGSE